MNEAATRCVGLPRKDDSTSVAIGSLLEG